MSSTLEILPADPLAGYLEHKQEIDRAVLGVLQAGRYILGPEVEAFEREFARYLGVGHALGVASGTDALVLALQALGMGPGDTVATVSHTAVATVAAIELVGAEPLLVDVEPVGFNLDSDALEAAAEARAARGERPIRAVVAVHLYGRPADMAAISRVAERHGMLVVEDCAQAHGARLDGRMAGTFGQVAAFSFYPTKNLPALGDGGAVATNDPELDRRLRELREYGWRERYVSSLPGRNSRLDELQAAVLRVRLSFLDRDNQRRRELAAVYDRELAGCAVQTPEPDPRRQHVYHQYVVRCAQRDALKSHLAEHGVGSLIHYPQPVHLQPAYRDRLALGEGGLPNTEALCREILSLPMYPQLATEQARRTARLVASLVDAR